MYMGLRNIYPARIDMIIYQIYQLHVHVRVVFYHHVLVKTRTLKTYMLSHDDW